VANLTAKDKWLARLTDALADASFVKLTLSGPRGRDHSLQNVFVRPVTLREGPRLQFVYRHGTRDVAKNFEQEEALQLIDELVGGEFRYANLFTTVLTANLEFRDGRNSRFIEGKPAHTEPPATAHDQSKQRRIDPKGAWLRGLSVTADGGKVAKGMEAKFRQIDKFVEVLASLMADAQLAPSLDKPGHVIDMGCGKGYLTFAAYDWLNRQAPGAVDVRGIEARPELVDLCNRIARESGFEKLRFEAGTIDSAKLERVDVLIALHACDTATDDAIAKGIAAGAKLIVVSPCCQKEVRPQLIPPPVLADALRHGILLERHAEFVTDALRAALLEWAGYEAKVFEFISTEHTAKNLMIAAVKRADPSPLSIGKGQGEGLAAKVRDLAALYGIREQRLAKHLCFNLAASAQPA
jgi:Methyltransferase domain